MQHADSIELPEPCIRLIKALVVRQLKDGDLDSAAGCDPGKGRFYMGLVKDEGLAEGGTMTSGQLYDLTPRGRKFALQKKLV